MVSISKRNKRTSLHQKYKVAKKVRQHNKKVKQTQKKQKPKREKMMEIPNDVPFKADIIKSIEVAKIQEKNIQKKRLVALNKLRNQPIIDKHAELMKTLRKDPRNGNIADVAAVIEEATVVIEVLDARDPMGTRSLELENAVKLKNKTLVFLLNKIDMVKMENMKGWLRHLSKEATVFPMCCKQSAKVSYSTSDKFVAPYGVDALIAYLTSIQAGPQKATVAIVGLANTGKSSVINAVKRRSVCAVATTTRVSHRVAMDSSVILVDTPGLVLARDSVDAVATETESAMRGCLRMAAISDIVAVAKAIFDRCGAAHLQLKYRLTKFSGFEEFMEQLSTQYCKMKKGGVADVRLGAKLLLSDWFVGKLGHCTEAPACEGDDEARPDAASVCLGTGAQVCVVSSSGPIRTVVDTEGIVDEEEEECSDECCEDEDCDDEDCDDEDCCESGDDEDDVDMDE